MAAESSGWWLGLVAPHLAAARNMGMSYKRARVLLDSINRAFTEPTDVSSSAKPAHFLRPRTARRS
jgi:hypothetical protein